MRRAGLIAFLVFLVAAVRAARLPCEIRTASPVLGAYAVCPVDTDGDSVDELYKLQDYCEWVERSTESYVWFSQSRVPGGAACNAFAADLDGDGRQEIVLTTGARESVWVYIIAPDSARGRRFLVQAPWRHGGHSFDSDSRLAAFVDLNGDGIKDLVLATGSGYDWAYHPRGVVALDSKTGERLWRFGMGPNVYSFTVADVDEDGSPEVCVATFAPGNGCYEDGTSDANTYVFCLNKRGQPRWVRRFRSGTGGGTVAALAHDPVRGRALLAVSDHCSYAGTEPDALVILDASDGTELRRVAAEGIAGPVFVTDTDGDGRDEVVTAEANRVVVRDLNLRTVRSRAFDVERVELMLHGHLLERKTVELALATSRGQVLLLNRRLETLAEWKGVGRRIHPRLARVYRRGAGGPVTLVVGSEDVFPLGGESRPGYSYVLLDLVVLPRLFPWPWVSAGLVLLLFGSVAVALVLRRAYQHQVSVLTKGLAGRAGVFRLDRHSRLTYINEQARRILGLGTSTTARVGLPAQAEFLPLRDAVARVTGGTERQVACQFVVEHDGERHTYTGKVMGLGLGRVLVGIEDQSAAEYARRAVEWVPVAQKLAHDIKNPLTAMSLALQRVERQGTADATPYFDSMKDDIERLKKMADGFMRLTKLDPPKLEPTDLNELVRSCLGKFEGVVPAGVTVLAELSDGLPQVALDPQQMAIACSNIVENAISAMGESGTLTVRTSLADGGKRLAVSVRDTGKGIPERYLNKLFQPYFTMKPGGTGLGLCITKRIIEDHKGAIAIQSKEGEGTTVTVTLPVAG